MSASTIKTFTVTGMSCGHCENSVKQELGEVAGIAGIEVTASTGDLRVTIADGADVTDEVIIAAVDEAGYTAVAA